MEQTQDLPAMAGWWRSMNGLSNAALCAPIMSADERISTAAASSMTWPARSSAVSSVNLVILGRARCQDPRAGPWHADLDHAAQIVEPEALDRQLDDPVGFAIEAGRFYVNRNAILLGAHGSAS